jgi:DNA ligase D-like protein (predicted 3'-phosphoesterase)
MAKSDKLREYKAKRRFSITPEPKGAARLRAGKKPRFVVQKHAASHLHFDFRLEVDGVLPSWAVPKGPSMDPGVKRLAVQTEDHPLDYLDFEGVIPEGQYGGGTVIVWDIGTYVNLKLDPAGKEIPMRRCLEHGHLDFWLEGKRLVGAFSLIRTKRDARPQWLLMKKKDKAAFVDNQPVDTEQTSVLSGRTI